jgi:DNA primase
MPDGGKIWDMDKMMKDKGKITKIVKLPDDAQSYLPPNVKGWLDKYHLTNEELKCLRPLYSQEREMLIFPVYAQGELLMWQGRYYGPKKDHPKYLTYGAKDVLHILNPGASQLVLTEDVVSAVRVSSLTTAMPLWGSTIGLGLATRLCKRFKGLLLWLDKDKASESLKSRSRLSPLFGSVYSIITDKDPKEYSIDEVASKLEGFL